MRLVSFVLASICATAALGQGYGGYGGGYGGGGDYGSSGDDSVSAPAAATTTSSAAPSKGTSASATSGSGATGGKQCMSGLMCVTAIVNATTTTYQLSQSGSTKAGWMAIGFGQQMANTPMVILWENADGSITISQRQASGEVQPKVVASPPRVATLDMSSSDLTGASPIYSFTIDTQGTAKTQSLIWAFGSTNPGSSDPAATLLQHDDSGPIVLDVSQSLDANSAGSVPATAGAIAPPLLSYQKLIVAHAVVFALAFMVMLPLGALVARYLRTTTTQWFKGHYLIQFYLTGLLIAIGFILAIMAVQQHGGTHFNDKHKLLGLVIVILYVVQCSLGAIIHFIKDAARTKRPPQNYAHAVLGLTIIGLAMYQIHIGYAFEWPLATGRGHVASYINVVWIIWVFLLPVLYAAGLAFLRRQFRQEAEALEARLGSGKTMSSYYNPNPYPNPYGMENGNSGYPFIAGRQGVA